jgi:hypothetical protein
MNKLTKYLWLDRLKTVYKIYLMGIMVPKPQRRTRMTQIGRIFTDTSNPRNPCFITFTAL